MLISQERTYLKLKFILNTVTTKTSFFLIGRLYCKPQTRVKHGALLTVNS